MSRVSGGDHQVVLNKEQSEALRGMFLQLLAYFSSQIAVQEALRNQTIKAAHLFGVSPKDITKATDLSNASVHRILNQEPPALEDELPPRMRRALIAAGGDMWTLMSERLKEG